MSDQKQIFLNHKRPRDEENEAKVNFFFKKLNFKQINLSLLKVY